MKIKERIQDEVEIEIKSGGFRGRYQIDEIRDKPHIQGYIKLPSLDKIVIGYNPDYETAHPGKLVIMARDVARHEQNHRGYKGYNGCPRNVELHSQNIIEPIAKVLLTKGFGKEDIHYIANTLEDSILHSDLSNGFHLDGISEFFSDVAESSKDGFTAFYDAHAKLNMYLWGGRKQRRELSKHYIKDKDKKEKISKAVKNFLERTGIKNLTEEVEIYRRYKEERNSDGKITKRTERVDQTILVKDRKKIRDFLNDESNWSLISKIYAEEFSELMEPSYAMPLLNHSGKGTKGRESEFSIEEDGNEFDKKMETEEFKIKRAQKAYQNDDGIPPMMESFETMDLVYQSLAKKLNFKVKTFTESEQRPVAWYGKRDFNPDKDDTKHISFGFDDEGKVILKKKPHNVKMNIPHKRSPQGFPKTRFALLDTSGSMKDDVNGGKEIGRKSIIPWGDKSKYHFGVLGFYGLI